MNGKILTLALCGMVIADCGNSSHANASIPSQEYLQISPILGDWSGILDIGMMKMTLVLHIQKDSAGALSATVDTLEHKINGTPIDWIEFDEGILKFEMKAAFAKFEGLLTENNSEISGQFVQAGQPFSLVFERGVKSVEAPNRPQEPKLPYPYTEEHISFENPEVGITLSGTLTLPASEIQPPVVLLIASAGPCDRDEAGLGHKPFLVLSDHLTRQGIAVLRFDKRGCGKSTGNYNTATSQDFANDVLAGIEYLKSRKEVNANQIGLIGHSEGGIIAPMVAVKSKDVAFIVLLAGPGVTGEELLYEQDGLIKRSMGETEGTIKQNHEFQKRLFALLKKEPDLQIASAQFHELATNHMATLQDNPGKVSVDSLEAMAHCVNTEWFRYFLLHDPAIDLKQIQAPVLALNGEFDLQVPPKQNLPVISKALKESGNKDFTIVELPKLNHLFQSCQSGSIEEYAKIEETISPSALNVISTWILGTNAGNRPGSGNQNGLDRQGYSHAKDGDR